MPTIIHILQLLETGIYLLVGHLDKYLDVLLMELLFGQIMMRHLTKKEHGRQQLDIKDQQIIHLAMENI